jgi:dihydrofolate synthase/folylpolyglutamate synthase
MDHVSGVHLGEGERTLEGLEELLAPRPLTTARWGLDRIEAMLVGLGRPERTFDSIHIAGTNGKGSTAAVAAGILSSIGCRTALYTSPHLVDVRERFQINGVPVPDDVLNRCAQDLIPFAEQCGATFFEATTALAFLCFAELEVEWAVVETGLGGRLDATNVLRPAVCGITQLDIDHADFLGQTLGEIAGEKAGIMKRGVPTVIPEMTHDLRRIFEQRAEGLSAPLLSLDRDADIDQVTVGSGGTSFVYRSEQFPDGLTLTTPLIGRHQAVNAGLAVLMVEQAIDDLEPGHVMAGAQMARLDGRLQVLESEEGYLVLDIAHNPSGVQALLDGLQDLSTPEPWTFLVAILRDKPWERMVLDLSSMADGLILTVAPSAPPERRWDLEQIESWARTSLLKARSGGPVEVEPDLDRALERARELSGPGTVVVTGSAHTVGDVLSRVRKSGENHPEE